MKNLIIAASAIGLLIYISGGSDRKLTRDCLAFIDGAVTTKYMEQIHGLGDGYAATKRFCTYEINK